MAVRSRSAAFAELSPVIAAPVIAAPVIAPPVIADERGLPPAAQARQQMPMMVKIPRGHQRTAAGGAEGNRTPDLLNAIQALSQLSYGPVSQGRGV